MFNKKLIALSAVALVGTLALTGCTSSNSSSSTDTSKDTSNITAGESTQSLETLSNVYNNSLKKADAEGIIEKTTYAAGNTNTMVYDAAISKSIAIMYQTSATEASPADVSSLAIKGNLASFANITYDDATMQVSNDSKGVFIITAKDGAADKTKVTITTKDGLITGYEIIDFNGDKVVSTTIQYGGITADEKAALTKFANVELPSTNQEGIGTSAPILIEE